MSPSPLIVLYDGECPFCSRSVAWLARRNRMAGLIFGKNTGEVAKILGEPAGGGLGTIVVWCGSTRLVRSTAALKILYTIGGVWRYLAIIGLWIPRCIRDEAYNFIAQRRHLIGACSSGERLSPMDLAD